MAIRKKTASKKLRKPRKNAALKTRNSGTMTESGFWSFIRSTLRNKSRWWKPILQAKNSARRKYKGANKRQKWEYLCDGCGGYFNSTQVSVDHIIPVGTLKNANDLPAFVENLFCEVENLHVLCNICHDKKSKEDRLKMIKDIHLNATMLKH